MTGIQYGTFLSTLSRRKSVRRPHMPERFDAANPFETAPPFLLTGATSVVGPSPFKHYKGTICESFQSLSSPLLQSMLVWHSLTPKPENRRHGKYLRKKQHIS